MYSNYANLRSSVIQVMLFVCSQIGDFGLARDLGEEDVYLSRGGKVPIKWTAPEVSATDPIIVHME